jgi:tetratricopeptide (TPR) repeat protein
MKHFTRLLRCGLVLAPLLAVAPSWAADEALVSTAREVAKQGLAAYDAGRYEEAADKLIRAYEVVKVPTLALYGGRALQKLGKLIEAAELFLEATQLEPTGAARDAQLEAQREASREREALLPRIPRLLIQIEGATVEDVTIDVDSVALPQALVHDPRLVNPGQHTVRAKRGDQEVTESVLVVEAEQKTVVLRFAEPTPEPPAIGVPPSPAEAAETTEAQPPAVPATPNRPAEADRASADAGPLRTLGLVGLGLGTAGVMVGSIAGLVAITQKSQLDDEGCDEYGRCYWDQHERVDLYNRMRTLSTLGFVAGGVGLAAGITLLVAAPESQENAGYAVRPWVGVGHVGLDGRF